MALKWDDKIKGLHLRADSKGRESWYLYYRTKAGTQRRPKLGDAAVVTLTAARELARDWLLQVAQGKDPSLERQGLRAEMTVRALYAKVLHSHWKTERFRKSGYRIEVRRLWHTRLEKAFGKMKLSEVTAAKVRAFHASLVSTPYEANRALAVLSKLFSWAEEQEIRPQGTNPCKLVKHHKEKERDRHATDEEVRRVAEILEREAEAHPREVAFITLLILTGSRPSGIERARKEDLELRQADGKTFGILRFQGKSGDEKVYLPESAVRALARVETRDGSLAGRFPRAFWENVRGEAGCKSLWARDWRRTFATTALSDGHEAAVISELLNHKDPATTKIYAKLKEAARVEIAEKTAAKLETLMKRQA